MIARVLSPEDEALLADERACLGRLQRLLAKADIDPAEQEALTQSVRRLDELFLLVVVGEFNSGKSTFINALLGQRVLEEGATPTTRRVHVVVHGSAVAHVSPTASVDTMAAPVEMLRQIHIVDTPGTNAIFREHEAITTDFVPRADFVLFVTSADRPFTETERGFLEVIREWGKKILIVVNKVDILETPADLESVLAFVRQSATALLGVQPEVFPLSARLALRSKVSGEPIPGAQTFGALERFLATTLDERERLRLKLLNPLGVGTRLAGMHLAAANAALDLLKDDVLAIDDIERQLTLYQEDMRREFRHRLASVDNILHEFERRGVAVFGDTLR